MVDGKPRLTPAHQTTDFGELVCSNSLKSESRMHRAVAAEAGDAARRGRRCCALRMRRAVPAGHALAVDRVEFSRRISRGDCAPSRGFA